MNEILNGEDSSESKFFFFSEIQTMCSLITPSTQFNLKVNRRTLKKIKPQGFRIINRLSRYLKEKNLNKFRDLLDVSKLPIIAF